MICFPNAKINLGLHVTEKRADGFHNIETVFYPVGWNDALEVIEAKSPEPEFNLHVSGLPVTGNTTDNLLYKAFTLIRQIKPLPAMDVYLHKVLPMGAGLGGGSSDAAFFINLVNEQFDLNFPEEERLQIARQLGSDCAFFIKNKPVLATQKGDVFEEINLNLAHLFIAIIYPNVHSNTKEAYSLVKPQRPSHSLPDILTQPVSTWKHELVNDFEKSIFSVYPVVEKTKNDLYDLGALYACMSGSGSAVFGLFEHRPVIETSFPHWIGKLT
ncbi:MAG: 4-diphosphocytidyl-2C-methyl-D-erythritol kinase [Bacteroidota bacterium]|jgi:4-diphosphocytidyl-2-C-methyl-D-erythritol kinase|nr:4-diphosphocytidyl-2C-methyl-D-erythritol kinase [Bacteroidota bacterium]